MTTFIYLATQIVGNPDVGYGTVYYWDGERFGTRELAIEHGFRKRGSDDFNIGVFDAGKLVSIDWMEQVVESDPADMARIQEQNGLRL